MLLSLYGISKRLERSGGAGKVVLDDVSLELERGQILGVYGPSGAGKTTLLQIAAGLLAPDDGEVSYEGRRLDRLPAGEWKRLHRQEIACVWAPQTPEAGLEVLEHVAMPLWVDGHDHRGAARRAREALAACEAEQCAGMMLRELSDGERQRVAIARAIVIEPRLLLADGPARNLSLVEQEAIMVLLSSLAHDARVAVLVTDSDSDNKREVVAHLEDYEPARTITSAALAVHHDNRCLSTCRLQGELERLTTSAIVLNRGLREAVQRKVARGELSMSQIAMRCGRFKHDKRGNQSGETSWLARRIGQLREKGQNGPTPWVHTDVLALIVRDGLGASPREIEL